MKNKIFLENYTLIAKHGYYKEEHFKPQRFVVSVVCDILENTSGKDDKLAETIGPIPPGTGV